MQTAKDIKGYRNELRQALSNEFQRTAMDNFAVFYRGARARAFAGMDLPALIADVAQAKDAAMARMDELLAEFTANAQKAGVTVHVAATGDEANAIIADIARAEGVKRIVKSKSMTAEETLLNHRLEADGYEVTETDLGEWIIQLRHEGPTHMVMPAIHLSRYQVADLFSDVTGRKQEVDIQKLVKVARRELRLKFAQADMGISGANFALADTGTLGIITNEGNGRLVTTLPRVHVALVGLDKLVPSMDDALKVIKVLPRNATAQAISSYVTWITGQNACAAAPGGKKSMHVVFLDNGRRRLAADPVFSQALRCVRCGACANVCPIYRQVGGHTYGHIYIGAVGLVLTYFYHGRDKAKNLVQNCLNCGTCKAACVAGIDLPYLIKEVHARILAEEGRPFQNTALSLAMRNRTVFHGMLRTASLMQKPLTGGTPYLRHLPMFFAKDQEFRALPAIADKPFRDRWKAVKPHPEKSTVKAALFSGCVQDFVYPEQAEAAVSLFHGRDADLAYPMDQTCCGLPALMMGEKKTARDVALQNIKAFDDCNCDYILTLCASCASHLKKGYPRLLADDPKYAKAAERFAAKIIDFSTFARDVLKLGPEDFTGPATKTALHAPCHLCRGLGVTEAPRDMLKTAGLEYAPYDEEDVCCGFGGTFSLKFPELSAEILKKKLQNVAATGASLLITDCPGCVMQLRGGADNLKMDITVKHSAEVLAERRKK